MTNQLDKLAAIVAARTPGRWKFEPCNVDDCWCAVVSDGTDMGIVPSGAVVKRDAAFIATMGSCADELLAVVRAASDSLPIFAPEISEDGAGGPDLVYYLRLVQAFAALEARLESL